MSTGALLLDTCAALWLGDGAPVSAAAADALIQAERQGQAILISPITAWEVGKLVAKQRVALPVTPAEWFDKFIRQGIGLAPLDADILIASSFLPQSQLRDPADCIIVATARALDARVVTRDRLLLDYASYGHIKAVAC